MIDREVFKAYLRAPEFPDEDHFVSAFLKPEGEEELLRDLWKTANLPFSDFLTWLGLTQSRCSRRFCIPLRTVQHWSNGDRAAPLYVRFLIADRLRGWDIRLT